MQYFSILSIYIYTRMWKEVGSSLSHWQPTEPDLVLKVNWLMKVFEWSFSDSKWSCPQLDVWSPRRCPQLQCTQMADAAVAFPHQVPVEWALEPPGSQRSQTVVHRIGSPQDNWMVERDKWRFLKSHSSIFKIRLCSHIFICPGYPVFPVSILFQS